MTPSATARILHTRTWGKADQTKTNQRKPCDVSTLTEVRMTRIAKDIMVTKLVTLEPETPVLLGIQKLIRSNIKGAPVVDRCKSTPELQQIDIRLATQLFLQHNM